MAAPLVIAVDGPAASGKGTLARRLAAHYGLPYLDTGLLYRMVARALLDAGHDLHDAVAAEAIVGSFDETAFPEERLRGREIGEAASVVAAMPAVRAGLLTRQRRFAAQAGGAVLDGRDIGTVIVPDADAKLYVTASPEVRARRRQMEDYGRDYPAILADILARDQRDAARANAPMRRAEDADLLDTSDLSVDDAVKRAIALVTARLRG